MSEKLLPEWLGVMIVTRWDTRHFRQTLNNEAIRRMYREEARSAGWKRVQFFDLADAVELRAFELARKAALAEEMIRESVR